MDDEAVLQWLMGMTAYIAQEHSRLKNQKKPDNSGPHINEKNVYESFDEGFARWMGWRGETEQENEIHRNRTT